jgi:hypothetical protein
MPLPLAATQKENVPDGHAASFSTHNPRFSKAEASPAARGTSLDVMFIKIKK